MSTPASAAATAHAKSRLRELNAQADSRVSAAKKDGYATKPLLRLCHSLQELHTHASMYDCEGQIEASYVLHATLCRFYLQFIAKHARAGAREVQSDRVKASRLCEESITALERMHAQLQSSLERQFDEAAEEEARAWKRRKQQEAEEADRLAAEALAARLRNLSGTSPSPKSPQSPLTAEGNMAAAAAAAGVAGAGAAVAAIPSGEASAAPLSSSADSAGLSAVSALSSAVAPGDASAPDLPSDSAAPVSAALDSSASAPPPPDGVPTGSNVPSAGPPFALAGAFASAAAAMHPAMNPAAAHPAALPNSGVASGVHQLSPPPTGWLPSDSSFPQLNPPPPPARPPPPLGPTLRPIHLPANVLPAFYAAAQSNTVASIETCGILCGRFDSTTRALWVTHVIVPRQTATADTCATTDEEQLIEVQTKLDLLTRQLHEQSATCVGWIHTHPSQTCFLSSVDLHCQFSYQIMLEEALAIVLAPKFNPNSGVFHCTKQGMQALTSCNRGGFHKHDEPFPLYTQATHHIWENDPRYSAQFIDLRVQPSIPGQPHAHAQAAQVAAQAHGHAGHRH